MWILTLTLTAAVPSVIVCTPVFAKEAGVERKACKKKIRGTLKEKQQKGTERSGGRQRWVFSEGEHILRRRCEIWTQVRFAFHGG